MSYLALPRRGPTVFLLVAMGFLAAVTGCGDDDLLVPATGPDISGVVLTPEGQQAEGAMVYLGIVPEFLPFPATSVIDSVLTGQSGGFSFDELDPGTYQVYAGMWNRWGDGFSLVSPFSSPTVISAASGKSIANLTLHEMKRDGIVAGTAYYEEGTRHAPADSAEVLLYRYLGAGTVLEAEGETNDQGQYALPGVRTGNYIVSVTRKFNTDGPFPLFMAAQSETFFCPGEDLTKVEMLVLRDIMVEKPAVYVYPREAGTFRVELALGTGVRLTASEPDYGAGWSVFVDRNGRIDGSWDYLFYEVGLRGAPRIDAGWCLSWAELFPGLDRITADLGLNEAERQDFLLYWRERLPRRDYYEIHPVLGIDLDPWVRLAVDPAPETSLRFWLFFEGRDMGTELVPPPIQPVPRVGTTVVEWGGALLP